MKAGYPGKLSLYADYVKKALDCFSEEVELWFAFTEPNIPIDNGYIKQIWYPFVHDPKKAYHAHFHKIVATATAVKIAKEYPNVKSVIIEDDYRIDFIKRHLYFTINAKEEGCHCHGYLIWSFIDNLSAINAFKNRYGLLELDLNTYKRKPKKSLYWLKDCIEKGIIE